MIGITPKSSWKKKEKKILHLLLVLHKMQGPVLFVYLFVCVKAGSKV